MLDLITDEKTDEKSKEFFILHHNKNLTITIRSHEI